MIGPEYVDVVTYISNSKEYHRTLRSLDRLGIAYEASTTPDGWKITYTVFAQDGQPWRDATEEVA
jgi:hypothetical protein